MNFKGKLHKKNVVFIGEGCYADNLLSMFAGGGDPRLMCETTALKEECPHEQIHVESLYFRLHRSAKIPSAWPTGSQGGLGRSWRPPLASLTFLGAGLRL